MSPSPTNFAVRLREPSGLIATGGGRAIGMIMKTCKTCGKPLPASMFHKESATRDGLRGSCKSCRRSRLKKPVQSKTCRLCGDTKPSSDFYGDVYSTDLLQGVCKQCGNPDSRRRRLRNNYEGRRSRTRTEDQKEHHRRWCHERNRNYPEKLSAHKAVFKALRSGEIKKAPCEHCGNPEAIAHHDDYSKPLDVRWLCRKCHSRTHSQYGLEI